ncbi:unnamed protein product [Albugo candida]|uniref:BROMI C-terminal Rab TBC-like domain-containing protein n=1 Tax=Albugo candida TaxID=65357 RepID=A0A024GS89_9STRA|nr:unnamed protein product [Albugo candida]|eukprot:CCI49583.1 unnamed protein product [Albugo candida]
MAQKLQEERQYASEAILYGTSYAESSGDRDSRSSSVGLDALCVDTSSLHDDIASSTSSPESCMSACNALQSAHVSEKLNGAASIAKLSIVRIIHNEPMCESVCKALIQHGFWSDNEVVHTTCCSQFLAIIERMENVSLLMDVFFLLVDSLRNAIERQANQLTYFDFVAKHPKAQTLIPTIRILERMLHRLPEEWSHSSPKVHARVYQSTFSLLLLPFTHSPSPIVLTIMASLHAEKDHKMHWFQLWLCRSPYRQQIGCSVRESGFWNAIWDRIDVCQPLEMLQPSVGPLETVGRNVMREIFHLLAICAEYEKSCGILRIGSSESVSIDSKDSQSLEFQTFDSENDTIFHLSGESISVTNETNDVLHGLMKTLFVWFDRCVCESSDLLPVEDIRWLPFRPNKAQSSTLSVVKYIQKHTSESDLFIHQHLVAAWYLIAVEHQTSPLTDSDVLSFFAKAWKRTVKSAICVAELPPVHKWDSAFLVRNASILIESEFCDCFKDALEWCDTESIDSLKLKAELSKSLIHMCRSSTALSDFFMLEASDDAFVREFLSMRAHSDSLANWLQIDGCLPLLSFQPLFNALWSMGTFSECFTEVNAILSSLLQHLETSVMVQFGWEECPAFLCERRNAFTALLCVLSSPLLSLWEDRSPSFFEQFVRDSITFHFVERSCASFHTVGQDVCVLRLRLLLAVTNCVFGCHRIASLVNTLDPITLLQDDEGLTGCHRLADRLLVATSKRQWQGKGSNQAKAQEPKVFDQMLYQTLMTYLNSAQVEGSVSMESVCDYVWALVTEVGASELDTIDLNRIVSNVMIAIVKCVKPPKTHNITENCDLDVRVASKYQWGKRILEMFCSPIDLALSMERWTFMCQRSAPDCFTVAIVIMTTSKDLKCDILRLSECVQLECSSTTARNGSFEANRTLSKAVEWIVAVEAPQVLQLIAACNGSVLSMIVRWRNQMFWRCVPWSNVAMMTLLLAVYGPEFQVYIYVAFILHLQASMAEIAAQQPIHAPQRSSPFGYLELSKLSLESFDLIQWRKQILTWQSRHHHDVRKMLTYLAR